ncbi:Aste57867_19983 [Aphanomyces stellatus]|uniref:Aste57867_19983 protein n=1 Tax=Aphanomyces stellatus TaxID=120398 RepID=A0A485LFU7_9STRA|nr:hypothetical protein As57867_019917 [Aphanomyces stellatus]VFT96680.1 Aste57867_19983 [Aphanomyces stellatus]
MCTPAKSSTPIRVLTKPPRRPHREPLRTPLGIKPQLNRFSQKENIVNAPATPDAELVAEVEPQEDKVRVQVKDFSHIYSDSIVPCMEESYSVVDLSHSENPAAEVMKFTPGDVVQVMARTWPGINKLGGTAWVTAVNPDDTYNVKYVLGGRENNVHAGYVSLFTERSEATPVRSATRKRSASSPFSPPPEDVEEFQSSMPARRAVVSKKSKLQTKEPMVLLCSGLSHEEKNDVEECAVRILDAKIVQDWTPDVTHIIVQCQHLSASKLKLIMPPSPSVVAPTKVKRWVKIRSLKFLKALVSGRWIVSSALSPSVQTHEREAYEVQGLLKAHNIIEVAKKARLLREKSISTKKSNETLTEIGTGLFAKHIFFVHGQFASPLPPKHEICTLLQLGKGTTSTVWSDVQHLACHDKNPLPVVIVMENTSEAACSKLPDVSAIGSPVYYVGYEWVLDCIGECTINS